MTLDICRSYIQTGQDRTYVPGRASDSRCRIHRVHGKQTWTIKTVFADRTRTNPGTGKIQANRSEKTISKLTRRDAERIRRPLCRRTKKVAKELAIFYLGKTIIWRSNDVQRTRWPKWDRCRPDRRFRNTVWVFSTIIIFTFCIIYSTDQLRLLINAFSPAYLINSSLVFLTSAADFFMQWQNSGKSIWIMQ